MTEYVGRTGALRLYSYPESRRNTTVPFARNFAAGPDLGEQTLITTPGIQVPWSNIDVVASPPTQQDVPITTRSTGFVKLSAVIAIKSSNGAPAIARVFFQINGITIPVPNDETVTVPANGFAVVPMLSEVFIPLGITVNVQVLVNDPTAAGGLFLAPGNCSLSVEEVVPSTG